MERLQNIEPLSFGNDVLVRGAPGHCTTAGVKMVRCLRQAANLIGKSSQAAVPAELRSAFCFFGKDSSHPATRAAAGANTGPRATQRSVNTRALSPERIQWVFLGPPGVGKGTYSTRVAVALGVAHIAAGDLVRYEIRSGTALGQQVGAEPAGLDLLIK